jgi:hypothetical protein
MKKLLPLTGVILIWMLSSCAVGRKLSFENSLTDPGYKPSGKIAIVFQDKRPDVLTGKEKPTFCGHAMGGYAIAYNVQTESGKPLAQDFSQSIQKTLEQKGVPVTIYTIEPTGDEKNIIAQFANSGYDKLLFFDITRWESRCTANFSNMRYEANGGFTLKVIDKNGTMLAQQEIKDQLVREQGAGLNMKVLQAEADDLFKKLMQDLMTHEKIKPVLM